VAVNGDESLSATLRTLTSAELYLYASFHASHPHFITLLATEKAPGLIGRFFQLSHTFEVSDLFNPAQSNYTQLVKFEALKNCQVKRWSPLFCLMALASVTGITIHSLYPEIGGVASGMYAVKLFNAMIEPQNNPAVTHSHIHLLWSCLAGTLKDVNPLLQPNHIVPLFFQ